MSPLSLYIWLFRQSHLFLICVVLTYIDSRIIPRKTCQNPRNCQCKWLLVTLSAPRTSLGSSGSTGKILVCTGVIVTNVLPSLVPPRHIDDCSAIHFLHWEMLWSAVIKSPKCPALGKSFGKCVYTLCSHEHGSTSARGSIGSLWDDLEVSALLCIRSTQVAVLSSTKFSLNSWGQSSNSCGKSLCTSSDSPFYFFGFCGFM